MAQQDINYGASDNDEAADTLRAAFQKTQANFGELYETTAGLQENIDGAETIDQQPDALTLTGSEQYPALQTQGGEKVDVNITNDQIAAFMAGNSIVLQAVRNLLKSVLTAGTGVTLTPDPSSGDLATLQIGVSGVPALLSLPTLAKTANYTATAADAGKVIAVTTAADDLTITLPTTGLTDGQVLCVRKVDADTGRVTVSNGSADLAWLSAQSDLVAFRWNGSAWTVLFHSISPLLQIISATSDVVKPPLVSNLQYSMASGGSGGGSGRRGAAGTARYGGGGGIPGTWIRGRLRASLISAGGTTVTIGAGGAGGAAVTANDTNGNAGAAGSDTTYGNLLKARANQGFGAGGTAGTGNGGTVEATLSLVPIGGGGNSLVTGTAQAGQPGAGGGGGGGGGIGTDDVARSGNVGGIGSYACETRVNGGTANGGPGQSPTEQETQFGGSGGGGGNASISGAATAGGTGGVAAGGGGGGASLNGNNSGAGGNGGAGIAIFVWEF